MCADPSGACAQRLTKSASLVPLLQPVTRLPARCARLLLVTEDGEDNEARSFVRHIEQTSRGAVPVEVLSSQLCRGACALSTLTHSDLVVAGMSSFAYLAAVLAQNSSIVAFGPLLGEETEGSGHWRLRQEQSGRPKASVVTTAAALEQALRAKLQPKCWPRSRA